MADQNRHAPEADAVEQDQPIAPDRSHRSGTIDEPEADALEQDQPITGSATESRPATGIDVPEADAIEQAQPGVLDDDDDAYRE